MPNGWEKEMQYIVCDIRWQNFKLKGKPVITMQKIPYQLIKQPKQCKNGFEVKNRINSVERIHLPLLLVF